MRTGLAQDFRVVEDVDGTVVRLSGAGPIVDTRLVGTVKSEDLEVLLLWATWANLPPVVGLALANDTPVNCIDAAGMTPLHIASYKGFADVVPVLLSHGADCECRRAGGDTPLITAARSGHLDVVELLLEAGADVNAVDEAERSPLYVAKEWKHHEIAKFVKSKGGRSFGSNIGRWAKRRRP